MGNENVPTTDDFTFIKNNEKPNSGNNAINLQQTETTQVQATLQESPSTTPETSKILSTTVDLTLSETLSNFSSSSNSLDAIDDSPTTLHPRPPLVRNQTKSTTENEELEKDLGETFKLQCNDGYKFSLINNTCLDINECVDLDQPCPNNADCVNNDGSFTVEVA